MEPTPVTVDEATAAKLAAAANGHPVPLRNPAGEVIGYYLTPDQKARDDDRRARYAEMHAYWNDAEIARIEEELKNDPRPDLTTAEVLRRLEAR